MIVPKILFFILLINICSQITMGQIKPLGIYTSKTLFHSIPMDKNGQYLAVTMIICNKLDKLP
jgi:hypothetical protein